MSKPPPLPGSSSPASDKVLGYYGPQHSLPGEPRIPNPAATGSLICGGALGALFLLLFILPRAITAAGGAFGSLRLAMIVGDGVLILWPLLSVLAVVLGILGIRRARRPGVAGAGRARTGLGLGIVGLLLTALGIVATLMMQATYGPGGTVNRSKCSSNLRLIGQAINLYANDNAGQFPARLDQLVTACDLGADVFVCPATDDLRSTGRTPQEIAADLSIPGHCSYVYLGAGLTARTTTPKTILAHDRPGNHAGKGLVFLYGDYRVEWVEMKEAQRLLAELKAGFNPPRPKP